MIDNAKLKYVPVGTRIWFPEEVLGYIVRSRGPRYLICTKPFNPKRTVLYTVIDLDEGIRGRENLVFGFGAETDAQCQDMLDRLQLLGDEGTEVSHRHRIPLRVSRVEPPYGWIDPHQAAKTMIKATLTSRYGDPDQPVVKKRARTYRAR